MKRTVAYLLVFMILLVPATAGAGVTITETFDTQTSADIIGANFLWDTASGIGTLQPWQLTSGGSSGGLPGSSSDILIQGNRMLVAGGSAGVLLMNLDNPTSPGLDGFWSIGTVVGMDLEGDLAALATTNGTFLLDVSDFFFPVIEYSKVGEFVGAVEILGNRLYVSTNDSLRILDISNPSSPQQLGSVPLSGQAYRMQIHGRYAYCARGVNLSVVDIFRPDEPVRRLDRRDEYELRRRGGGR